MPEKTETVTGNPTQEQSGEDQKNNTTEANTNNQATEGQVSQENASQPSVEACILKPNVSFEVQNEPAAEAESCSLKKDVSSETDSPIHASTLNSRPKSPEVIATEEFLINEKGSFEPEIIQSIPKLEPSVPFETSDEKITQETNVPSESAQVPEPESVPQPLEIVEPRTPANSEASESGAPNIGEEPQEAAPPQIVEVSHSSEPSVVQPVEEYTTVNGDVPDELPTEVKTQEVQESASESQLTNGQSNGECKLEPKKVPEHQQEISKVEKPQVLIDSIANELRAEDYKLPDVDKVKKQFEYVEPAHNDVSAAPPKKGALSTRIDSQSIKQAYEDVRYDGSDTEWAVFKFEGPTIVTSATGADFAKFRSYFADDERAFGYIRVLTGDEMSRRAKFLLVTWIGPAVSVLKRAKMSTDKALMKEILSNFAVELQTENIADINLQNFVTELDKAAGAHYGTGVRAG